MERDRPSSKAEELFAVEEMMSEGATLAGRFYWKRITEPLPYEQAAKAYGKAFNVVTAFRIVRANADA